MAEMISKQIELKIFESPISSDEFIGYAADKGIKIAKVSKDTFLLGEISVDSQVYGLLGLEKEYWSDEKSGAMAGLLDQTAVKLFDKSGKNTGIIEERMLKELSQSISGAKLPVFTITLKYWPYLIDIEKESDKFVFPLLINKTKGTFEIFQISKKALAMGADFLVTRKLGENKVAFIDSKRGGKIEIQIYDSELAKNPIFIDTLALFAGTIKFHDSISSKIESTMKALTEGTLVLRPSQKALELMQNPRLVKQPEKVEEKVVREKETEEEIPKKRSVRRIRGAEEEEEEPLEKPEKKRGKKRAVGEEEEEEEPIEKPVKKRGKKRAVAEEEEGEAEESELPTRKKKMAAEEEVPTKKPQKIRPLYAEDSVRNAPGLTEAISELLEEVGVMTVEDLMAANSEDLAQEIGDELITSKKIKLWQQAARQRVKAVIKEEEDMEEREQEEDSDADVDTHDYDIMDI